MLTPKFIILLGTLAILCSCQNQSINQVQLVDHKLCPVPGATVHLESTSSGHQTPIAVSTVSDSRGVVTFKEKQNFNKFSFIIVQTPQMKYVFDYDDFRSTSSNLILIEGIDPESYRKKLSHQINSPNKTLHLITDTLKRPKSHENFNLNPNPEVH